MPLGVKPVCTACKSNTSSMWSKNDKGEIICNACVTKQTTVKEPATGNGVTAGKKSSTTAENIQERVLRKSSRNKPSKYRIANSKPIAPKGKGRRIIFKKAQPVKAPTAVSTVVTGESIFYEGLYYQVGDIVSLVDDDENVYYAQIRGFLQDQYYEKSAVITWLLPTQATHGNFFDPSTYILGPEEDLPRKMEFMEFVCHTPSDYFKSTTKPYPTVSGSPELCYIWSNVGPEIRPAPSLDEVYGPNITIPNDSQPSIVKKTKLEKVKVKTEKDDKRLIVVE